MQRMHGDMMLIAAAGLAGCLSGCAVAGCALAGAPDRCDTSDVHVIVNDGTPLRAHTPGAPWSERDGALVGHGRGADLEAGYALLPGDFEVTARLRMLDQAGSAASFFLDDNHFGFEGARNTIFVSGPMFDGLHLLGPSTDHFERGAWIDFRAVRAGDTITFFIDDAPVASAAGPAADSPANPAGNPAATPDANPATGFERIGFRPWRSTIELRTFTLRGNARPRPAPPPRRPRGYTIPLIDLAADAHRRTVVDREPGQYLGHPTTVLLEDGRTIIAVYPKGHGRGAIVMKRSPDGGRTWSDRLPVPDNWATSKETPTIHRVIDPRDGAKRLVIFSGLYPIRMATSEDDGATWTPLSPIGDFGGIVAMGAVEPLRDGRIMALFHDDGRFIRGAAKTDGAMRVYKTLSSDGARTWSEPVVIATHPRVHLCEPGLVRSPDGNQIAVLLRENSRTRNSYVIVSDDEGDTWTAPRELPAALTGDRHTAVYAPDGRLFISFRDTTHESPTKGDWVAWVGTYDDIAHGRDGQYRVRLMDNHKSADCAYPGVVALPDGTIVTTTYGHWTPGEEPYIVTVRLTLAEVDARAKDAR